MSTAPLIYSKINSIMLEVEHISKAKKNQQQGFMYRGIDDLYNALHNLFGKHGVFVASEVLSIDREERQSKGGGLLLWTVMQIKFTFYATDGSSVSSVMTGEAMDSADKSANKAMSVALKYCLFQLLLIPTEDVKDSDPDATVHDAEVKPENMIVITDAIKSEIAKAANKAELSAIKSKYLKLANRQDFKDLLNERLTKISTIKQPA